jgi:hypothetical protein
MRTLLMACALAFAGAGFAQSLEPGEWEFTSTTRSPMLPKAHSATVKQCVTKEDADNPERWMGRQNPQSDCKITQGRQGADTVTWEMHCPKSNMRSSGSARIGAGTMESEMHMAGEVQGRKFDLRTQMSGRRLGPCKS